MSGEWRRERQIQGREDSASGSEQWLQSDDKDTLVALLPLSEMTAICAEAA